MHPRKYHFCIWGARKAHFEHKLFKAIGIILLVIDLWKLGNVQRGMRGLKKKTLVIE